MKTALVAALMLVAVTADAGFADPPIVPPGGKAPEPSTLATRPTPVPEHAELNENVALGLSLGFTVGAYAMMVPAFSIKDPSNDVIGLAVVGGFTTLLTPGIGHWYAGTFLTAGLALRVTGVGLAVAGAATAICILCRSSPEQEAAGAVLGVLGGMSYLVGTVYDIATAPRRARAANQHHVTLAPIASRDVTGLAVIGAF